MNYVVYFDEVKDHPQEKQFRFSFGGIVVPISEIRVVEEKLHSLAEKYFGNRELLPASEFHASFIYSGKGAFKGAPVAERLEVLRSMAEILSQHDNIGRVIASINTDLYAGADASSRAFMYFCERVHMFLKKDDEAILIGDLDEKNSTRIIKEFAGYRATKTDWDYGVKLSKFIDSVHFSHSHHSRLLQLADLYLFLETHKFGSRKGWAADKLSELVKPYNLYPHRHKDWPKPKQKLI